MNDYFVQAINETAMAGIAFAGPPLLFATIIGFLLAVFQAVTSIQDQTLPQTVKIVTIVLTLIFLGGVLSNPVFMLTDQIFTNFGYQHQ